MSEYVEGSSPPEAVRLEEYQELREGAALVDSRSADWLRVTGADRLRFANGLATCDLRALDSGQGAYGFFTDAKGKIVADAVFLAFESELWIDLPRGQGPSVAGHMGKYLVADQVEIEELEGWKTVFVAGPEAEGRLGAVLGDFSGSDLWNGAVLETGNGRLVIRADRRLGVPAWTLAGPEEVVGSVTEDLCGAGLRSVGASAVEALRIEQGVPWFGFDFGPDVGSGGSFPQETGIEDWAVSFEKGCYLGQEVIARIHFRGKVNRSLRGLVFERFSEPRAGVELTWNEEVVGVVHSVATSPTLGGPIGLAIVHHKAEPGSELSTPAGSCRLVELPFRARD